uniref:LPS-assembly protein LptD n=1 Tax=Hylemonella sp. TaxID=2066020 RepID=UPI0035ADC077
MDNPFYKPCFSGPSALPRLSRPALNPLALLLCALWHGSAAQAQSLSATPLELRLSPMLAESLSQQQRTASPTYVYGERLSAESDTEIVLEGGVEFRRADMTIRADRLEYDQARDLARARGDVRVNQAGNVFEGPALDLRIDAFEGFFDQARYRLLSNDAHGEAERIDFLDDKRAVVRNATFTTCQREPGPDWMPAWILRAATLRLDSEEEAAEAEDVTVSFQNVRVLGLSSMTFPLTEKRKSGFLSPTFSADNISGTSVTTPYYWNIAPNRDATFYPTVMSQRGVNYGGQFRYLEAGYSGQLRADYMPSDKLRDRDRWGRSFQHRGGVSDPSWGALGLNLNLNRVSDDDYWRDFPRATPSLTQRLLANDVGLNWNRGPYSATLRTLQWQTLQDPLAPIVPPYDRLPQIVARYTQPYAAGFDLGLEADYTDFQASSALTGQPNAQRSVAKGQLSYPLLGAAGFIIPRMSVHSVNYNFDRALANGQRQAGRTVPTYSLDTGLVFERDASYFGSGFRQTLEPRLFYVYTPYVEQNYLPNYDSGLLDFNFASIYSENAFVGNDRIADNNLLTGGLSTRLLDPDTGAEILRLGIAQRLRFEDQRVTLPGGTPSPKGVSDILLGAGLTIDPRWQLDSTVQYNQKTGESERSTVSMRYNPSNYRVVNVAYRYQRNLSELVDIGWQWPLNDLWGDKGKDLGRGQGQGPGRWYSVGRLNYSMQDDKLVDSIIGFEYDAGCWLGRIVLERLQTGVVTSTRRIMFQLELVGFSRVGIDPLQSLQRNIPRYQVLRQQVTAPSRFSNYD